MFKFDDTVSRVIALSDLNIDEQFNTVEQVEKKQERGEEQELQFREALESFGPDFGRCFVQEE